MRAGAKLKTVDIKMKAKNFQLHEATKPATGLRNNREEQLLCVLCAYMHKKKTNKKTKTVVRLCSSDIAAGNIIKWDGGGTVTVGFFR